MMNGDKINAAIALKGVLNELLGGSEDDVAAFEEEVYEFCKPRGVFERVVNGWVADSPAGIHSIFSLREGFLSCNESLTTLHQMTPEHRAIAAHILSDVQSAITHVFMRVRAEKSYLGRGDKFLCMLRGERRAN